MSLTAPEAMGCLAMAQGLHVIPALGDSYEAKSAAAVAGLLAALAAGEDQRLAERIRLRAELEGLLGVAPAAPGTGWQAGLDRLMAALGAALEQAEATDPARNRLLLDWLVRWTANERLVLPRAQPAPPAPA